MKKRKALLMVTVLLVVSSLSLFANGAKEAEVFPSRPITLIVPWSAGGGTDAIARAVARNAEKHLGVPVIVENKPGGTGAVGLGATVAAKPDGYTLAIIPVELSFLKDRGIYPFDFSDFTRIMNLNTDPAALTVSASAPWDTIEDFIAYARQNPGQVTIGHSGTGMLWHLAAASLALDTGTTYTYVPFNGAADAIASVLGDNIDAVTVSGAEVSAQVRAGTMKILAILGDKRLEIFPEIPTALELGYDVNINTFRGLGGPEGIPEDRVEILRKGFKAMMEEPDFINVVTNMGLGIDYRNTEDYFALTEETAKALAPVLSSIELE